MDTVVWSYVIYLVVSVVVALWVGWSLFSNGRVFLIEIFLGKEDLADSINHLLVVGFYLISLGFVMLLVRFDLGTDPTDTVGAIESVSAKLGVVLIGLGAMHLSNLLMISFVRRKALLDDVYTKAFQQDQALADGTPGRASSLAPTIVAPAPVSVDAPTLRHCSGCGETNELDSDFCVGCGTKLSA